MFCIILDSEYNEESFIHISVESKRFLWGAHFFFIGEWLGYKNIDIH